MENFSHLNTTSATADKEQKMATPDRPPAEPQTITPETFRQLLARYPDTVEAVTRRKASTPRKRKNAEPPSETEITTAVREFLELDDWRYRGLPGVVGSRAERYLDRSEAERLVEWKMYLHFLPFTYNSFYVCLGTNAMDAGNMANGAQRS